MALVTGAVWRSARRRLGRSLAACAVVVGAAASSGCAVSRTNTIARFPAVDTTLGTHRAHASDYVTIIDSSTVRAALRQRRSVESANLTRGQKAAVLGGGILLVLLAIDAMDATDDLSEHIDPVPPQ